MPQHAELHLDADKALPGQMGSELLLEWARACKWRLSLTGNSCAVPGLAAFVDAAPAVGQLDISCDSLLDAAQADKIVHKAKEVGILILRGDHFPTVLPQSVEEVAMCNGCSRVPEPGDHVEALLYRLAFLPCLEGLDFDLGVCPVMTCPSNIPHLQYLRLSFEVLNESSIDLSWLRTQPLGKLELSIVLRADSVVQQGRLVSELTGLKMHSLNISLHTSITLPIQLQWTRLRCLRHFMLDVAVAGDQIRHLPSGPLRIFSVDLATETTSPVLIAWSTICSQAGRFCIYPHTGQHVGVVGYAGHLPGHAKPWQLLCRGELVLGLPESACRQAGGYYFMQNGAADAAGWKPQQMWAS